MTSLVGSYSRDKLERSVDQEKAMTSQDIQETERLTAKNAVEEYIYGIREKISEELQEYMAEEDRLIFMSKKFNGNLDVHFLNLLFEGPHIVNSSKTLRIGSTKMVRMSKNPTTLPN